MKKLFLLTSIILILAFSGCASKGKIDSSGGNTNNNSSVTSTDSSSKDSGGAAENSNSQGSNSVVSKPLNSNEKEKIDSIIDSINSSLKSLDDVKDIDLSSIN